MADNLKCLYDKALEMGSRQASLFSAFDIVVDKRPRLKCLVPRYPFYSSLMCQPNLMSLDGFRKALARYTYALLVQKEMHVSSKAPREKYGDGLNLSQLSQSPSYLEEVTVSFYTFLVITSLQVLQAATS